MLQQSSWPVASLQHPPHSCPLEMAALRFGGLTQVLGMDSIYSKLMLYIYIYIYIYNFEFTCQCRRHKRHGLQLWVRKILYLVKAGLPWWLSWLRIRLQCRRPGFDPWVGKIPWRRERLPTPVFWPREFHGLYSPWACKELVMTGRLSLSIRLFCLHCSSDWIRHGLGIGHTRWSQSAPGIQKATGVGLGITRSSLSQWDGRETGWQPLGQEHPSSL